MKRSTAKLLLLASLMMLPFGLGSGTALGQEPKRFVVQKPQQLTSMKPREDVTVGGIAAPIPGRLTHTRAMSGPIHSGQIHSGAVISGGRSSHYSVAGWDSNPQKYLVLDRSVNSHLGAKEKRDQAPLIERRPVEPYAYGWFGTKMNRHPHRSFGYQQAYTQWSFE